MGARETGQPQTRDKPKRSVDPEGVRRLTFRSLTPCIMKCAGARGALSRPHTMEDAMRHALTLSLIAASLYSCSENTFFKDPEVVDGLSPGTILGRVQIRLAATGCQMPWSTPT